MRFYMFLVVVLAICASKVSAQVTVDFEDLATGSQYYGGQSFQSNGIVISVDSQPFLYGGGHCTIGSNGYTNGYGNEVFTGNVMLHFNFGSVSQISLLYGNYGGYTKIQVNGDMRQVYNILELNGVQIGGASAFVTQNVPSGNARGYLKLTGPINSFAIGGQEFAFDNVTAVPEPSVALSLFTACCSMIGIGRIYNRRK